jgi:hypothetical protein
MNKKSTLSSVGKRIHKTLFKGYKFSKDINYKEYEQYGKNLLIYREFLSLVNNIDTLNDTDDEDLLNSIGLLFCILSRKHLELIKNTFYVPKLEELSNED